MSKAFHIPTHSNGEVTETDSGSNTKGHVLSGVGVLDRMTQPCLPESCPSVLEVRIFFPNYILHVKQTPNPFAMYSLLSKFLA